MEVVEKQATSPDCVLNLPSTGKKRHPPALKASPETSMDEAASEEAESSRPELPPRLEDSPSDSQGGDSPAPTESDAPLKQKPSLSIESADAIEGEIQRGNPAKRTSSALYPLFHNSQPGAPSPKRKLVVAKGCTQTRRSTGKENEGEQDTVLLSCMVIFKAGRHMQKQPSFGAFSSIFLEQNE